MKRFLRICRQTRAMMNDQEIFGYLSVPKKTRANRVRLHLSHL